MDLAPNIISLIAILLGGLPQNPPPAKPQAPPAPTAPKPAGQEPTKPADPNAPQGEKPAPPKPLVSLVPDPTLRSVTADPNPFLPGQTVTFAWPAGATRVVVSGGDLKKPVTLTGKSFFTAAPEKAGTYIFEVWYPHSAADAASGTTPANDAPKASEKADGAGHDAPKEKPPTSGPKADAQPPEAAPSKSPKPAASAKGTDAKSSKESGKTEAAAKDAAEDKQRYKVTVGPEKGTFPKLTTYQTKYPWRVDYVANWKAYPVTELVPGATLVYLQPIEDSPERIAVASWPVPETTSAAFMEKVMADAVSEYDVLESVQQKPTIQAGLPAAWLTFRGVDHALPGIPTQSIVMTLIRNHRGFVISARTRVSRLQTMETLLRGLVRSFSFAPSESKFTPPPTTKNAAASKGGAKTTAKTAKAKTSETKTDAKESKSGTSKTTPKPGTKPTPKPKPGEPKEPVDPLTNP